MKKEENLDALHKVFEEFLEYRMRICHVKQALGCNPFAYRIAEEYYEGLEGTLDKMSKVIEGVIWDASYTKRICEMLYRQLRKNEQKYK